MSSIAHFANLEIHGQVMIAQDTTGCGFRSVYYGEPACCAPLFTISGKKTFSVSGRRVGGLARVIALAEERGPRELDMVKAQIVAHQARQAVK